MTTLPTTLTVAHAELVARSRHFDLRAERKSQQTLKTDCGDVRFSLYWCAANDAAPVSHASLNRGRRGP